MNKHEERRLERFLDAMTALAKQYGYILDIEEIECCLDTMIADIDEYDESFSYPTIVIKDRETGKIVGELNWDDIDEFYWAGVDDYDETE